VRPPPPAAGRIAPPAPPPAAGRLVAPPPASGADGAQARIPASPPAAPAPPAPPAAAQAEPAIAEPADETPARRSPSSATSSSLFDLDLPSAEDLSARGRSSDGCGSDGDFDSLPGTDGVDGIDVDLGPTESAGFTDPPPFSLPPFNSGQAGAPGQDGDVLDVSIPPTRISDYPERRVSLAPPERARSADEQHEQRRRKTIERVLTLRDGFRLLGHLDVPEQERKTVGKLLVGLDGDLGVSAPESVIKDPAQALRAASKEQLDVAERQISVIEDRMLALDELVTPEVFGPRIEARKQSKKAIARYARLLASRRMPAGQRRDRFEWIATHLLTARTASGELAVMPPERARTVLQHMIGGLPRKLREQELQEALAYLNEASARLDQLKMHDELFESGLYLDFHGYKVSMREQLLSAEFVYLSVLLNAKLHNRLERWIGERERLHDAQQLSSEGTPREQIMRRLRAQEEEVDSSFGVKRRSTQAIRAELGRESLKPQRTVESKRAAVARSTPAATNRGWIVLVLAVLVALGAGGYLLVRTGVIGKPEVEALDRQQLARFSPLLVRGQVLGDSDARKLRGWLQPKRWEQLDPRQKRQAADVLAKRLADQDVHSAQVLMFALETPVIEIERGTVTLVEGGKL
jgi:hypothetical protein